MQYNKIKALILIKVVLIIIFTALFSHYALEPINSCKANIIIPSGSNFNHITTIAEKNNWLGNRLLFRLLAELLRVSTNAKAGEFCLQPNSSRLDLLTLITSNNQELVKFTIVEGWTFNKIIAELAKLKVIKHELQATSFADVCEKLNIDKKSPEGLFYPDTYYFTRGSSDLSILKLAYENFLAHKRQLELKNINYENLGFKDFYSGLILASIIEKETANLDEYRLISGVYNLRLKKRMRLQADPSVIYAKEKQASKSNKLSKKDLQQVSPYNTYLKLGLPPTPICMPGIEAIKAAFFPKYKGYLYFVVNKSGSHKFSKNYRQHRFVIQGLKR